MAVMRKTSIPKGIPVRVLTSGTDRLPNPGESKIWRESHDVVSLDISK
jgi:hypothetical protein